MQISRSELRALHQIAANKWRYVGAYRLLAGMLQRKALIVVRHSRTDAPKIYLTDLGLGYAANWDRKEKDR